LEEYYIKFLSFSKIEPKYFECYNNVASKCLNKYLVKISSYSFLNYNKKQNQFGRKLVTLPKNSNFFQCLRKVPIYFTFDPTKVPTRSNFLLETNLEVEDLSIFSIIKY